MLMLRYSYASYAAAADDYERSVAAAAAALIFAATHYVDTFTVDAV